MSSEALEAEFVLSVDGVREVVDGDVAAQLTATLTEACTTVRLSGKALTLGAAQVVAEKLVEVTGLAHLDISDIIASRPEDEAKSVLAAIASACPASALQTLDVSDNALGLKGIRALAPLLSSCRATLQHLTVNNDGLEGRAVRLLSLLLTSDSPSDAIDAVPAPSRDDNDDTVAAIIPDLDDDAEHGLDTVLTKFHTFNNLMESAGARALGRLLLRSPALEDLRVSSTRIGMEGGLCLAKALSSNTVLTTLDLSDNSFGARGCSELFTKVVSQQRHLHTLRMAATGMEDDGLVSLSAALGESKAPIKVLDISCNEITSEVADDIATMLKVLRPTLQVLKLAENEFGSNGIAVSIASLYESHVSVLDLSVNECSDSGAVALARVLPSLRSLNSLQLNGNMIGRRGLDALHSALQLCSKTDVLGEMDLNDDEYDEQQDDADDDRIAAAFAHLEI